MVVSTNIESIIRQCIIFRSQVNVVIADGEIPQNPYLVTLLADAACVLCCDGAINLLENYHIEPDYIIGDCDSLSLQQQQKYAHKIKCFPDQNSNDLTKAVDFAVGKLNLDNLIIMGATGLREDHSLANIGLLVRYAQYISDINLLSDYGMFTVCNGSSKIATVPGQQISLFAINSDTRVSTRGLKWDLDNLLLDNWYKGTLNQALEHEFDVNTEQPLLVYRAFEIKT